MMYALVIRLYIRLVSRTVNTWISSLGGQGREFIILGINKDLRRPIFGVLKRGNGYSILLFYRIQNQ